MVCRVENTSKSTVAVFCRGLLHTGRMLILMKASKINKEEILTIKELQLPETESLDIW
jgi:hypothetical protein